MSSEIKALLTTEMKVAMKAKQKPRLAVIRSMQAAIKQIEIDGQKTIDDDAVILPILDKMLKQRRDSFQQFTDADRPELAEQESYEMEIIQEFLPQPLTEEEIVKMVEDAITESGAASMQEMGKVMGLLKPKMQGRADMGKVSGLIKEALKN
jgi:uncharacterized protein YqeY